MMRALSILSFTFLLIAGVRVGEIAAQAPLSTESAVVGDLIPTYPIDLVSSDGPSWQSRVWNAVAGAALGAGVGYFASQLASGDWDDGEITRHRRQWAVVGGSVGLVTGFSFPFFGRGASLVPTLSSNPRTIITALEISESSASTAYEAVRLLRPNWLADRGVDVFGQTAGDALKVYVDGHRFGGIETLSEISARNVQTIRFFGAAQAVARWGAGHAQGAILVNTIG